MRSRSVTKRSWGVAGLAMLALLLAAPAQSSATTFGADLSRTPADLGSCFEIFSYYSFGTVNSPSCTFESQNLSTGESGFPPAGKGVVTKVRVKVGPVTGPMQIVVEQALRQDNPSDPGHPTYACCKAIQLSQVFTPSPNGITEVPVNLSVRQDISPDPSSGLYVDQHLALSVLAPDVPVPMASDPNGNVGGWSPAWSLGQERVDHWGFGPGATVLFNADWSPESAATCSAKKASASQAQSAKKKKKKKSACGKKKKKKKKGKK
jgi:hypothetical protein